MSWQELSQSELDAAYDQAEHAENMEQLIARMSVESHKVIKTLGEARRIQYGKSELEGLDLYPAANDFDDQPRPVLIFIHGGTWRFGTARDNAFAAEHFVSRGVNFIVPDFSSVSEFGGELSGLVNQLEQMVRWVYLHAHEFGGDPDNIYLSGFSSGAHLAGVLLSQARASTGLPANVFKGALLCSGIYDMRPVARSSRSEYVSLNETNIPVLSPLLNISHFKTPLLLAYGTRESPEFQRQAKEFHGALLAAGKETELVVADDYNHFEIIETLADPGGVIGAAMARLMGLSAII